MCVFIPDPASAQVYEIATSGEMRVRAGGGSVNWQVAGQNRSPAPSASQPALSVPAAQIADTLINTARRYSLHPALLEALVWQESRWQVNAVSPKGAMGLTQLMPATARELGVDPRDPMANLEGGARYLRQMLDRFGGNLPLSLAAYNAGARRVEASGGIPPIRETQVYVAAILNRLGATHNTP